MHLIWSIFFNFTNIRLVLLLMCVISTEGNKVMTNSGYVNVFFVINGPLKRLLIIIDFLFFQLWHDSKIWSKNYLFLIWFFKLLPKLFSASLQNFMLWRLSTVKWQPFHSLLGEGSTNTWGFLLHTYSKNRHRRIKEQPHYEGFVGKQTSYPKN